MRTLALDIGDTRIGLALSDTEGRVATPLKMVESKHLGKAKGEIEAVISEYEVDNILIGLPLSLSGEEGPQARHVRALSEKLLKESSVPLCYFDERLSSASAKEALWQQNISTKDTRGKIDMIAATIFLQTWLDLVREDDGRQ